MKHLLILLLLAGSAVANDPDWNARGRADYAAGNMRAAKLAFENAVRAAAGQPLPQAVALADLGQTMLALGEWSQALRVLRQARTLIPESPHVLHLLGQALYRTGERAAAQREISAALALATDDPELSASCRSDLATLFAERDDAETLDALREAITDSSPGQPRARMRTNLGILLWKAGDKPEAVAAIRGALKEMEHAVGSHHPDMAFILENYAIMLKETGKAGQARQAADRARDLKLVFAWQANATGDTVDVTYLRRKAATKR